MQDSQVSETAARIVQTGFQTSASDFKQKAMERLKALVPFDMALWASGHLVGTTTHNVYLYGLPDSFMQAWEQNYKNQDRLLTGIINTPKTTFDVFDFYAKHERPKLEIYRQHAKVFGVENAIATAYPNQYNGLLEIMSLYRSRADRPFTEQERLAKQFLFPLMIETWHGNQINHFRSLAGKDQTGAAAVCDSQGLLRHAEGRFVELVNLEWPGCQLPRMPQEAKAWLAAKGKRPYKGEKAVLQRSKLDDLFLLRAHQRGAIRVLSAREEEVAESFAAGLTHKEIAADLNLSPSTVRRHIESIYQKLEVSSKVELHRIINQEQQ